MDDPTAVPESTSGPPRWVKVFGIVALLVVLLVVVMLLAGDGGGHGPGRHTGGHGDGPPSGLSVTMRAT